MKKNVGSPLMKLLQEKNKTTADLATALEVRERTIFYWLSGERIPRFTLPQVRALCDFLECSFDELPLDFSRDSSPKELESQN